MAKLPSLAFGASYYPQHVPREEWSGDLEHMVAAHVNVLRVGDFAWKRLEPQAGNYQLEWLGEFLDLCHEHKVAVLLIPPIRCAPAWLMEQVPEIGIADADGVRLEFGSRYTFCINHPEFVSRGLQLTKRIAQALGAHPAVAGWHLDNEYGDEPDCHCAVCKTRWHGWLAQRYHDIQALNSSWGTVFWGLEFCHFGQVPTPARTKTYHNPGLLQAWRQFRSDCTVALMAAQRAAILEGGGHGPITTNLQSGWNRRTDYHSLPGTLDLAGVNYYPPYGDGYRSNALGLAMVRGVLGHNFHLHELRNGPHAVPGRANNSPLPGEIERLTLHSVAHGADAIFYFQWRAVPFGPEQSHGTPTGYDGEPNRSYAEVQRVGQRLAQLAPHLQDSQLVSEVALVYDFPTRWVQEGGEEWCGPSWLYLDQAKRLYGAICATGVNCDVVGRDADWSRYKVLVVPMLDCVTDPLVERLRQFVVQGGVLVWHPLSGLRDQDTVIYPRRLHPVLEQLFGLSVVNFGTAGKEETIPFQWQGTQYQGRVFADLPQLKAATPLGHYLQPHLNKETALAANRVGLGMAYYVATFGDEAFYQDFLRWLLPAVGVPFILGELAARHVEVTERRTPEGRRLVFLTNATSQPRQVPLGGVWQDLETNAILPTPLCLKAHEVRVIVPTGS